MSDSKSLWVKKHKVRNFRGVLGTRFGARRMRVAIPRAGWTLILRLTPVVGVYIYEDPYKITIIP